MNDIGMDFDFSSMFFPFSVYTNTISIRLMIIHFRNKLFYLYQIYKYYILQCYRYEQFVFVKSKYKKFILNRFLFSVCYNIINKK